MFHNSQLYMAHRCQQTAFTDQMLEGLDFFIKKKLLTPKSISSWYGRSIGNFKPKKKETLYWTFVIALGPSIEQRQARYPAFRATTLVGFDPNMPRNLSLGEAWRPPNLSVHPVTCQHHCRHFGTCWHTASCHGNYQAPSNQHHEQHMPFHGHIEKENMACFASKTNPRTNKHCTFMYTTQQVF